jgi:hypothetical protein
MGLYTQRAELTLSVPQDFRSMVDKPFLVEPEGELFQW